MAIKKKAGEKLDSATLLLVISKLNDTVPITKKEACELLNISYNTTRLGKILKEFEEGAITEAKIRKNLRKIPLDLDDKSLIIKEYLCGMSLTELADSMYRSVNKIKSVLHEFTIPLRQTGSTYNKPILLPEGCLSEDYNEGDLVYSARYDCPATIKKLHSVSDTHGKVYRIYLLGKEMQYAYQPYYELGSLTHLQKELGINL